MIKWKKKPSSRIRATRRQSAEKQERGWRTGVLPGCFPLALLFELGAFKNHRDLRLLNQLIVPAVNGLGGTQNVGASDDSLGDQTLRDFFRHVLRGECAVSENDLRFHYRAIEVCPPLPPSVVDQNQNQKSFLRIQLAS